MEELKTYHRRVGQERVACALTWCENSFTAALQIEDAVFAHSDSLAGIHTHNEHYTHTPYTLQTQPPPPNNTSYTVHTHTHCHSWIIHQADVSLLFSISYMWFVRSQPAHTIKGGYEFYLVLRSGGARAFFSVEVCALFTLNSVWRLENKN